MVDQGRVITTENADQFDRVDITGGLLALVRGHDGRMLGEIYDRETGITYLAVTDAAVSLTSGATAFRVAGYLAGSDNEGDYVGFAFINGSSVTVWSKYRKGYDRQALALGVLVGDRAARMAAGEAYAQESSRCFACNRMLTVPSSISAGRGPDCAAKGGY